MEKRWIQFGEWSVLLLLVLSVLWKGGKGLETLWLVAMVSFLLTLLTWRMPFVRRQMVQQGLSASMWLTGILLILWTCLSFVTSQTRNYGLDEVMRTASLLLLFLWVVRLKKTGDFTVLLRYFVPVMAGLAVLSSCIGMFVYTLQPVNRFVGTFFDPRFHTDYWPNAWAQFLLLTWPLVLLIALDVVKHRYRLMLVLSALSLIVSALLLSYSRGALIACIGQIVFLAGLLILKTVRGKEWGRGLSRNMRSIGLSLFFVFALSGIFFVAINAIRSVQFDVQSVAEKATFTAAEGRSSVSERSQFWNQALSLSAMRPLLGWGPYSFRFVQTGSMYDVLATSDHPHNVLLKYSMERGIFASLLLLLLSGFIAHAGIMLYVRRWKNSTALFLTSLAGVAAHNMIDFNLQFLGIALPVVVIAGLLYECPDTVSMQTRYITGVLYVRRALMHTETLLSILLLIVLLWEGSQLGISSLGRHAEAAGRSQEALHWYRKAEHTLFSRDMYLSMARLLIDMRAYGQAQGALRTYGSLNGEDARAWKLQGELALRMGQGAKAVTSLAQAYERGRFTNASILRLYVVSLMQRQDDATLESRQADFEDTFLRFAEAIEENAHYIALSRNPEELLSLSQLLISAYPQSAVPFAAIAGNALDHAREERMKYASRPPGILW